MSGPWSNTVEAADSDELQSARRIAVALEQRLAEVRKLVEKQLRFFTVPDAVWLDLAALIDAELTA